MDTAFKFYVAMCRLQGREPLSNEYGLWAPKIKRLLGGIPGDGIAWLNGRVKEMRSRGVTKWGLDMLMVDAGRDAEERDLKRHETVKAREARGKRGGGFKTGAELLGDWNRGN